ncbi:hypothetical protein vseg_012724 [Gypsophila vaccaria]
MSDHNFGDYTSQAKVICKVGELLGHDLGWAAVRLNDSVRANDDKAIRGLWSWLADGLSTSDFLSSVLKLHGPNPAVIGWSARLDMYGIEFGLGKAIATRTGFGNKSDGKVNASQGCEGGGSVDLEISLLEEHMAALEADHEFLTYVS